MFDARREILEKFIQRRVIANDRANLHLIFVITLVTRRLYTRELHGHADNAADPDRRGVDRDTKEIQIPRNDLIRRSRRTGIIITLLPISSETDEGVRGAAGSERESDREEGGEGKREKKGESERAREGETGSARSRAFRSRHPVYRSAVRDAGPMAWRSWQIIITNHQLFARNG